jgi:hypothetical protein
MGMAERKARTAQDEPRVFEVLNRQPNGHETVHRFMAHTPDEAVNALLAQGVDRSQVVEVREASAG